MIAFTSSLRSVLRSRALAVCLLAAAVPSIGIQAAEPNLRLANGLQLFLQIEGVKGDVTTEGFKDHIDILGFSWGASNSGTTHMGGGGGAGKVNVQDLSITKYFDRSSPALLSAVLTGNHIAKATLRVVQTTVSGQKLVLMEFEMKEVLISSLSNDHVVTDPSSRVRESATLNFSKIKLTNHSTGGSTAYDVALGKGI